MAGPQTGVSRHEDLDFPLVPTSLALTTWWKEEQGFKVIWVGESPDETLKEREKDN